MWPTEALLRLLIICTLAMIYFVQRVELNDQLKDLMKVLPLTEQSTRMDLPLWLLLGACCFAMARTLRLRMMKIFEDAQTNLDEMQAYVHMQQPEPEALPGMDADKLASVIEKRKRWESKNAGDTKTKKVTK